MILKTFVRQIVDTGAICRTELHKSKTNKDELLQLKFIHLFASELLLMKKLEIKKTKSSFIILV